jgi:tripartite-type tricarboxylate transporter receptor subunit TctC
VQAGVLRPLAVTAAERSPFAPEVPTVIEAGVPGFTAESWNGVLAPAVTPEPIVRRMAALLAEMARDPEVIRGFAGAGATPVADTPDEFATRIEAELEQWRRTVSRMRGG